ncbi:hypothetical protein [Amycolatopsis japonica]
MSAEYAASAKAVPDVSATGWPVMKVCLMHAARREGTVAREAMNRLDSGFALGRYVAPGSRLLVSGAGSGKTETATVATAEGIREQQHSATWAAARTSELHRVLAALDLANHEWRLLTGEVTLSFTDRPDLLRRASDPNETTLFAREIYQAVLDVTQASHNVRQAVWHKYNAASQAVAAARGERRPSTPWWVWVAGTGATQEVLTAPLQTIDTEAAFLAHLRLLVDHSTLSTRTLLKAVEKRVPSSPGHSTLVGWLKGEKLPKQLSEPVLRAIVGALAANIIGDNPGTVQQVAHDHVRTYRMLLAKRQGEALVSGPVHRALDVLANKELQLGLTDGDRIKREVVRELREQILAELAADHARATAVTA